MTHYLYKPHVQGPEFITTPDILVDRLYRTLNTQYGVDLLHVNVNQLSTNPAIPCHAPGVTLTPAYILLAAGGGILLSAGAELADSESGNNISAILIPRFAWRLKYLQDHLDKLIFAVEGEKSGSIEIPLHQFPLPDRILDQFSSDDQALPRGTMICVTATGLTQQFDIPEKVQVSLHDPETERELSHRIALLDVKQDQWEQRPLPRYSVGPTKGKVKHYI